MSDHETPDDHQENGSESNVVADKSRIISYNVEEGERPDGIKVRYKITVVTGKHAAALDARQADAIRELLLWTRTQRTKQPPPR